MCDLQKLLTSSFLSVYKKKVLGTFILHLLNCINFMKNLLWNCNFYEFGPLDSELF